MLSTQSKMCVDIVKESNINVNKFVINDNITFIYDMFKNYIDKPITKRSSVINHNIFTQNNRFISDEIMTYAKQPLIKSEFMNDKHTIIIYDIVKKTYKITRLFQLIDFVMRLGNSVLPCTVHILLAPHTKQFLNTNSIDPVSVNSGMCDRDLNHILIWRRDELEKVLLHELIHFYNIDKVPDQKQLENLYKILEINDSPLEAITECWAVILHVIWLTYSLGYGYNYVPDALAYEQKFSKIQAAKVAKKIGTERPMKQTTNAYSYYVIKSAIFKPKMLELLRNFNMQEYIQLINNGLLDINEYSTNNPTARMTCIELNNWTD